MKNFGFVQRESVTRVVDSSNDNLNGLSPIFHFKKGEIMKFNPKKMI